MRWMRSLGLSAAVALGAGCSLATITTAEVQDDGSYIERRMRTVQVFQNTITGFQTRWDDRAGSATLTDETSYDREESSEPGAEVVGQLVGLIEKLALSGAGPTP